MLKRCLLAALCCTPLNAPAEVRIGAGLAHHLAGPVLEWSPGPLAVWAMPGFHMGDHGLETDDLRWAAGLRRSLTPGGSTSAPGFYLGAVAGDLGGRRQRERLGLGAELGHQWQGTSVRFQLSGGIAVLERDRHRDQDVEPGFFLRAFLGFHL